MKREYGVKTFFLLRPCQEKRCRRMTMHQIEEVETFRFDSCLDCKTLKSEVMAPAY